MAEVSKQLGALWKVASKEDRACFEVWLGCLPWLPFWGPRALTGSDLTCCLPALVPVV